MQRKDAMRIFSGLLIAAAIAPAAIAELRIQDVARLQGQEERELLGYGLVIGLAGTGDADRNPHTANALLRLHNNFQQPAETIEEFQDYKNVAIVMIHAKLPANGARSGQRIDAVVTSFAAESLEGGRLLYCPLQDASLEVREPIAFASGPIAVNERDFPTSGIIRDGALVTQDLFYQFVADGYITLVLNDSHASYPLANMIAKAARTVRQSPASGADSTNGVRRSVAVIEDDSVQVLGPKNVRVRIPDWELMDPAGFIARVLETPLIELPELPARVVINRASKNVSFTGNVTISPTVLQVPDLGWISIGQQRVLNPTGGAPPTDVVPVDPAGQGGVPFQELLDTLTGLQLSPEQMIDAIEHLKRSGTLHATVVYAE